MGNIKFALSAVVAAAAFNVEAMPSEKQVQPPSCSVDLPEPRILKNIEGPVSGPFILTSSRPKQTISLLSMNIQNIPLAESQNKDYRKDRKDCLTKLARRFDIAAFQEDFLERPSVREDGFNHMWKPHFTARRMLQTGSPGLSLQTDLPFERLPSARYSVCSGLVDRKNDCLASKGYQIAKLGGIVIVNTHLDAGRSQPDFKARRIQLEELAATLPESGPLLIVGDLNLLIGNENDESILKKFLAEKNLTLHARYSPEKGHDFVIGREVEVETISTVENMILSDHAGLVIRLSLPENSPTKRLQLAAQP